MLTPKQKALVHILTALEVSESSMIGIMLQLKDSEHGQNMLIEFLRNTPLDELTESSVVQKVREIVKESNTLDV